MRFWLFFARFLSRFFKQIMEVMTQRIEHDQAWDNHQSRNNKEHRPVVQVVHQLTTKGG
ncbi:hypothetical protein [Vibrio vulnificus YJ016]|uniref:Uncharacterized protein n=1 Tax=Vibrio vulnificus (strain YJ016) TaxID=196600 RepID=Q7MIC0_VIBVY|nr:hypothetical protein [Vibrio vulnificus YJ016]